MFLHQHRLQSLTYPDGRVVFYDFNKSQTDYPANRLSRISSIRDTDSMGVEWAVYDYNGTNRLAVVDLPQIDLKLDYFQGTAGTYAGYDRFGRIKDQFWAGYNSTNDADRFKYDYDYAGNPTYRDIDSAIYTTDDRDQVYTYDGLHRLESYDEGTLSGTAISGTPAYEQEWGLDALGNWKDFVIKSNGSTSLDQDRTVNDANEITDITETTGSAFTTPAYDAAGNATSIPISALPTLSFTCTYDAWNRLVKIGVGTTTTAEYEYDGLNRRIVKSLADHKKHYYYNENWQTLEVRKEVSGTEDEDPIEQFVWHPYYIDALATRFFDEDTDGNLAENVDGQYYFTHDANFNVTAAVDDTGTVIERYRYTAYGHPIFLDADFSFDADNVSDVLNSYMFTGRMYDLETTLYHYRNRYYDYLLGVFLTRDPVRYRSGANLYEYVRSRPQFFVDPNGLSPLPNPGPPYFDGGDITWPYGGEEPGPQYDFGLLNDVEVCCRNTDISCAVDFAIGCTGAEHCFISVGHGLIEAGLGGEGGVQPEEAGCYPNTEIVDHSGQSGQEGTDCYKVPDCNATCVRNV